MHTIVHFPDAPMSVTSDAGYACSAACERYNCVFTREDTTAGMHGGGGVTTLDRARPRGRDHRPPWGEANEASGAARAARLSHRRPRHPRTGVGRSRELHLVAAADER